MRLMLIAVSTSVDVVVAAVFVVKGLAKGVGDCQTQGAATRPFADGLCIAVAVEDVVCLLGVEDVLAEKRYAP